MTNDKLPEEIRTRIVLEARQFAFYNYVTQILHPDAVFENMDTWPGDARVCFYSILHYMSREDLCWPYKEPTLATEYATKLHQLQQENESLISACNSRNATIAELNTKIQKSKNTQPGAVWVKASERLPEKDGYYCFRANGGYMGAYLRTGPNGNRWWCDSAGGTIRNWKNCEWLDESGTAAGREEDAVDADELWDEHAEYIDDNIDELVRWAGSTVVTREQFNIMMAKFKQKEK